MRLAIASALVVAGCSGAGAARIEAMDQPALESFTGYHPEARGCIYGDCKAGAFARRLADRTVSGTVGARDLLIEWERGPCLGWAYRGEVAGDLPHGRGILVPARARYGFFQITAQFERGAIVGRAEAIVHLADNTRTTLTGAIRVVPATCAIRIDDADRTELAQLTVDLPSGRVQTGFRGVVRVLDNAVVPWRGTIGTVHGYLRAAAEAWQLAGDAICLRGGCVDGAGVEHLGGGRFELYLGEFVDGARAGTATVHAVDDSRLGEYEVQYDGRGLDDELRLIRPRYRIVGDSDGTVRFGAALLQVEGLGLGPPVTIEWAADAGMIDIDPATIPVDIAPIAGVPERLDRRIAAVALLARELPHQATARRDCVVCRIVRDPKLEATDVVAVTAGPRTRWIVGTRAIAGPADAVVQAWLPELDQELRGDELIEGPGPDAGLHGTGWIVHPDGSSPTRVVFYSGVRIDPLGFRSVDEYERATPATRQARAKRAAKAAAAIRVRDDKLVLDLVRVTGGTGSGVTLLDTARTAIAATATDAAGYERVIRGAHVAIEQAEAAVFDAVTSAERVVGRLDSGDPCVEPTAALAAYLHDLDERLRVVLIAFDAFDYTDDVDRLGRIAAAFRADLEALPTVPIAPRLAALRAAIGGAPIALPPVRPPPPPPAPGGD